MTRCDGGYGNPGRRSGCIAEGMRARPATTSAWRPAGSWGPRLVVFFSPLTLLVQQGRPAGNQSREEGILKALGDIWGQSEARPGCIAADAGAAGSWAQALL